MSQAREDRQGDVAERLRGTGSGPARPLDFVFVLRPAVMVPMWVFFSLGARLASQRGWRFDTVLAPGGREWMGLIAMTGILGGGYLLNQMVDIETDRLNDKLFFLPRGIISVHSAGVELVVVWLVALAAAATLGLSFLWAAIAALLFSVTYSSGGVRAKTRPGLDVIWNALGFGLVATLAGAFAGDSDRVLTGWSLWSIASYTASVAGVTASTIVLDRAGDEDAGLRTTAVVLGDRRTSLLGIVLLAAGSALGLMARDPVALAGAGVSLGLAVRAHAGGDRLARISANQLGVGAFVVAAALFSPYVLVLAVIVALVSRAYYRRRFGFAYPGPGSR